MICKSVQLCCAGILLLLLSIALQTQQTESANILGIFTSHSPSHLILHMATMKTLAERGHNVTVVTTIKPKIADPRINQIFIPMTKEQEERQDEMLKKMAETNNNFLNMVSILIPRFRLFFDIHYTPLTDERFQALYDNPGNKFDLVIIGFVFNDFQLGVAAKFKCPVIGAWMTSPMELVNAYVGNPRELAYVPNFDVGIRLGERMNFSKRLHNFFSGIFLQLLKIIVDIKMEQAYKQLFPKENFPTYREMQKNVSLVFCNSASISEGPIRPNVPALVEIGGIQIKDKPDPLPKDIADFLNASSTNGAILFSLGSNLQGSNIKPEIVNAIFKVLSGLKENVIWKWENLEKTPGKSANILYKKWLPQDDILAHPNVRLFITHAGKGGITEAQYHGVPMVALPVYADQNGNAEKMVESGYGKQLHMFSLNENEFRNAILEVLSNSSYASNVKRYSELYRDRPLSAKENVIYWTEYVIRHHGARHLQSPVIHMNVIQSSNLDVKACIGLTIFLIWLVLKHTTRFCYRKICRKCSQSKKNKKAKTH